MWALTDLSGGSGTFADAMDLLRSQIDKAAAPDPRRKVHTSAPPEDRTVPAPTLTGPDGRLEVDARAAARLAAFRRRSYMEVR